MRRSVAAKRNQTEFQRAQRQLRRLRQRESRRELDLYYTDEAGFSLQPLVRYAWQKRGAELSCLSGSHHRRQNVLGLLSCRGGFHSYIVDGSITTEVVIACIDALLQERQRRGVDRPVVLVVDNAPIHRNALFEQQRARWRRAQLTVQYLPRYAPELNLIEILWRRIKYSWLPLNAYDSWQHLTTALEEILKHVGSKYQITFS